MDIEEDDYKSRSEIDQGLRIRLVFTYFGLDKVQ
jgi:hypothetical protein